MSSFVFLKSQCHLECTWCLCYNKPSGVQSLRDKTGSLSIDTARFDPLEPIMTIQVLPTDLHESSFAM